MKITFAGVGNAFTTQKYYQSNMVVTSESGKRLLIDCGSDARFSLGELGATNQNIGDWINGVYISHLHADHIGGLEWLGFCTYFNPKSPKPLLFIVDTLIEELWESLRAGMRSHEGKILKLDSFFDVCPIPINSNFYWEKALFTPVQTVHVMDGMRIVPSYGLLIDQNKIKDPFSGMLHDLTHLDSHVKKETVFLTTDTQFCPRQIEQFYEMADIIFHDCETTTRRSNVHAHYDDLRTLPKTSKSKMWLYHYAPEPTQDALNDGFRGFVSKGQTFEI